HTDGASPNNHQCTSGGVERGEAATEEGPNAGDLEPLRVPLDRHRRAPTPPAPCHARGWCPGPRTPPTEKPFTPPPPRNASALLRQFCRRLPFAASRSRTLL